VKFLPDENGEVACVICRRTDNIKRQGANTLIGMEPHGPSPLDLVNALNPLAPRAKLYAHHYELARADADDFQVLLEVRMRQAAEGTDAEDTPR